MLITDIFSESDQSMLRNALDTVSLVQAILHSYSCWRRDRKRAERRRETGKGARKRAGRDSGRAPRKGASAPNDAHAPLLSAVTPDPVPTRHRGIDPATSHSDSACG